jgi:hypothetical protein
MLMTETFKTSHVTLDVIVMSRRVLINRSDDKKENETRQKFFEVVIDTVDVDY